MTRSERISYQMIRDSLLAEDLVHPSMIDEYFWQADKHQRPDPEEVAAVAAGNKLLAKFLLRYLDEFWKPEEA